MVKWTLRKFHIAFHIVKLRELSATNTEVKQLSQIETSTLFSHTQGIIYTIYYIIYAFKKTYYCSSSYYLNKKLLYILWSSYNIIWFQIPTVGRIPTWITKCNVQHCLQLNRAARDVSRVSVFIVTLRNHLTNVIFPITVHVLVYSYNVVDIIYNLLLLFRSLVCFKIHTKSHIHNLRRYFLKELGYSGSYWILIDMKLFTYISYSIYHTEVQRPKGF